MTNVKAPIYVTKALASASGVNKCWVNSEKASNWLFENLGLVTDDNTHKVNGIDVDFCWTSQIWYIS